jgi:hypothetical protein
VPTTTEVAGVPEIFKLAAYESLMKVKHATMARSDEGKRMPNFSGNKYKFITLQVRDNQTNAKLILAISHLQLSRLADKRSENEEMGGSSIAA